MATFEVLDGMYSVQTGQIRFNAGEPKVEVDLGEIRR